jgi:uncharacterized membrane protein
LCIICVVILEVVLFLIEGKRKVTAVALMELVDQLHVCLQAWKLCYKNKRQKLF